MNHWLEKDVKVARSGLSNVLAEIWTRHILNTSHSSYHFNKLAQQNIYWNLFILITRTSLLPLKILQSTLISFSLPHKFGKRLTVTDYITVTILLRISNPSWKSSTSQDIPFFMNWKFMTTVTRVCHWFLVRARWIQSTSSHFISFRFILILLAHLLSQVTSSFLTIQTNSVCIS